MQRWQYLIYNNALKALSESDLRISTPVKHIEINRINYFSTKKTRCESMNAIITWRVT